MKYLYKLITSKNTPARVKGGSYAKLLPPVTLRRKKVHSSEKASNLPKVTQLLSDRGSILTEHTVFATTSAIPEGISHTQGGVGVI